MQEELLLTFVSALSIAALAGHSDIQMLIDHYGHLQPNNLKSIITERFSDLIRTEKNENVPSTTPVNHLKG